MLAQMVVGDLHPLVEPLERGALEEHLHDRGVGAGLSELIIRLDYPVVAALLHAGFDARQLLLGRDVHPSVRERAVAVTAGGPHDGHHCAAGQVAA